MGNESRQPPKSLVPCSVDGVLLHRNSCFLLPFCGTTTQLCLHCSAGLYTRGKAKICPCVILTWASTYPTQRHTSHYIYCIHNLRSIICKQLKNSAVQTENHICQSAPLPRLKSWCALTRGFFAITSVPYNYSLENVAQDTFFPAPCKNYSTVKHWRLPVTCA